MVDLETLMKEAKAEEEREARESRDVFLNVIDRARVEQAKQVKEDPMLMWQFATRDKEQEKPEAVPVAKKVDEFWNGFMSGVLFTAMLALMAGLLCVVL